MTTILIKDFSSEAATKTSGIKFREMLEPLIQHKEKICVDFDSIQKYASPFFNNSFASLALRYGFDVIENIDLLNLSEAGQLTYNTSINNAKALSENPQYSDDIQTIINRTPKKGR